MEIINNKIISTEDGGNRKLILVVLHQYEDELTAGIFRLRLSYNSELCSIEEYHDGDWYDFTSVMLTGSLRQSKIQAIKSKLRELWFGEKTSIDFIETDVHWSNFIENIEPDK